MCRCVMLVGTNSHKHIESNTQSIAIDDFQHFFVRM